MKKYILKLLCALCFIMPFLPNVMADPLDDFYKSFIDVTKNYNYCDNFEEMDLKERRLEHANFCCYFNCDKEKMIKYKKEYPKEYIKYFKLVIMDSTSNPKKILRSLDFAQYLAVELTDLKIKNWICIAPPTKPEAEDKRIFNVYVNPSDNKLYVADGAAQALALVGKVANCPAASSIWLTISAGNRPTALANVPIDNYFNSLSIEKVSCEYIDIEKSVDEFMPYDKFMEEYQNYIGSLKK